MQSWYGCEHTRELYSGLCVPFLYSPTPRLPIWESNQQGIRVACMVTASATDDILACLCLWHPAAKVRLPQGRTLRFVLLGRHCVRQPAFTSRMCNSACMDRGMHGKPGVRWRPQDRPSQAAGALGTHTRQAWTGSAGGRLPYSLQNGAGLRLVFCKASHLQIGPMVEAGTHHHFEPDFVSRRGFEERVELLVPCVCAASPSSHCQCW